VATFLRRKRGVRAPLSWDIALGRWLALCVHPICAWRVRRAVIRALVVLSYFAAGYLGVLAALLAL
jgi:hypothetical protein